MLCAISTSQDTASNHNAAKIALYNKETITSYNKKFGVWETPTVGQCLQRPRFFFLSTATVLSSVPGQLLPQKRGCVFPNIFFQKLQSFHTLENSHPISLARITTHGTASPEAHGGSIPNSLIRKNQKRKKVGQMATTRAANAVCRICL